MQLTLRILNNTQERQPIFTFSEQGGSIGRSSDCSWCINGTFVSRKHAFIEYKDGQYYIIDNSTNGIELISSNETIKKGIPYKISDNDMFKIDNFEISAKLEHSSMTHEINSDPYEIVEPSHNYVSPKVDRQARINDPIRMPINRSNSAPSLTTATTATNTQNASNNIFQVAGDEEIAEDNFTPAILDDNDVGKNDLAIFTVQSNSKPFIESEIPSQPKNPILTLDNNTNPNDGEIDDTPEITIPPQIDSTEIYRMILKGAGVSEPQMPPLNTDEFYSLTGNILHECLQGIIDLLKSRTEVKGHLRLERTVIGQGSETNPLKFMPNAEQVMLHSLLNKSNSGYLPILDAIQEAFDDLKSHQFAMSMSVQDALQTTIQHHFSPDRIKQKLAKNSSILSKIPLQREAMLWGMFEELYSEIEQEAAETFELLLEREIAKAYKLHSMELKYHRKVQKRKK